MQRKKSRFTFIGINGSVHCYCLCYCELIVSVSLSALSFSSFLSVLFSNYVSPRATVVLLISLSADAINGFSFYGFELLLLKLINSNLISLQSVDYYTRKT